MTETRWTKRWNSWVSPTRVPGVFRRKEGGYLVRGRTKDPATGKDKEVRKTLDVESEALALRWLEDELERVRSGATTGLSPRMRFADYALSLAERKLAPLGWEHISLTGDYVWDAMDAAKVKGVPLLMVWGDFHEKSPVWPINAFTAGTAAPDCSVDAAVRGAHPARTYRYGDF